MTRPGMKQARSQGRLFTFSQIMALFVSLALFAPTRAPSYAYVASYYIAHYCARSQIALVSTVLFCFHLRRFARWVVKTRVSKVENVVLDRQDLQESETEKEQ